MVNAIKQLIPAQKPVEGIETMCDDLLMILRIVDHATIVEHLEAATNLLNNFTRKWRLNPSATTSPLYASIIERISLKRNSIINQDLTNSINLKQN